MICIVQCLCPQRHCMLAAAYDSTDVAPDDALEVFKKLIYSAIAYGLYQPKCEYCGSSDWQYENSPTQYVNLEEAVPYLKSFVTAQARMKAALSLNARRN